MSLSEVIRMWLNQPVLDALIKLKTEVTKMVASEADLKTALDQLAHVVTSEDSTIATGLETILAAIQAIQAKAPDIDLTAEVAQINGIVNDIKNETSSLGDAFTSLAAAGTPALPPTPPPAA